MVEESSTNGRFGVAAVQAEPVWFDAEATVGKTIDLMRAAADRGARIVGFPETWIPGYPWWIWLGSPAWGAQFVGRYHENSLEFGDEHFVRLAEAARDLGITAVVGYSEREGGTLYMSQAILPADGSPAINRRKLKPAHVERSVFGEGDGSDLRVIEMQGRKVGVLCCWEHLQPLTKFAMYSMREQIHVASWPGFPAYRGSYYQFGHDFNAAASKVYASEGQVFVLASYATVGESGMQIFADTDEKRELFKPGGGFSMIYGPNGSELVDPLPEDEEGLLVADVDLAEISLAKTAIDAVGHTARPEVMRLSLNREPTRHSILRPAGRTESSPDELASREAALPYEEASLVTSDETGTN